MRSNMTEMTWLISWIVHDSVVCSIAPAMVSYLVQIEAACTRWMARRPQSRLIIFYKHNLLSFDNDKRASSRRLRCVLTLYGRRVLSDMF
jgi:hypothetical protein